MCSRSIREEDVYRVEQGIEVYRVEQGLEELYKEEKKRAGNS